MSFGVINVRDHNCTFTTVHGGEQQDCMSGDFHHIKGFIQRSQSKVFVIQGLSDVVVVRDNSQNAKIAYENQRKCIECICKVCCLVYLLPCFSCFMKFESPDTLYSSIIGETFLFRDRCFIFDLNRFKGNIQTVQRCLENERDNDPKISVERRSALTAALKADGVFRRFEELVQVAKSHPRALFLIDSGSDIQGLIPKVKSYISIHFEDKDNPMTR